MSTDGNWYLFDQEVDAETPNVKMHLEWICGIWNHFSGEKLVNDGSPALANLTLYTPEETEGILSMEKFDALTSSIQCNADSIAMTFIDDATFARAQQVWDWVNGADNNSFVMVAGVGDCGNNTNRIPFKISRLSYDEVANQATLTSERVEWQSFANYDLKVGSVAPAQSNIQARDIDKSTSIDMNHDFPFSVALGSGPLEARLACTNCSSTGQFDLEFAVSQKAFIPTGASMKLKPKGVSAIGQIKLSGSGSVTDPLIETIDILEIPISGLSIPGILDFGPFLTVAVGAELSAITLTAGVTTGATAKLSDDAILEMDLLNPEENKFSGWDPEFDAIDVTVDGSISGGVAIFLQPSVELQAEALGKGFEIGLNLRVPNVNAKLIAAASPTGVCADIPEGANKTVAGVTAAINIGAALNIQALKSGDPDPLFTVQLAAIDKPLASKCFPFGAEVAARSIGHPHAPLEISAA
ncbi:hypothetical protein BS50DRAFT_630409 [Corynespora cassiicola Philippines]|uniref:Uncharacterized protein n=1 Tax=Corynespora cassiicola Philippines TaxID=1448308 RepID=A0A2T2P3V3_CORCC|nr:hypothetical protein BS50DRAFT_630409 [Corynespora cassiicola Philippines]